VKNIKNWKTSVIQNGVGFIGDSMAQSWQSKPDSTHDGYGNPIEMNQLPLLETIKATIDNQKKLGFTIKVYPSTPLEADHYLQVHTAEKLLSIALKDLEPKRKFVLEISLREMKPLHDSIDSLKEDNNSENSNIQ